MFRWMSGWPAAVLFPAMVSLGIAFTVGLELAIRRFVDPATRQRATTTAAVTLQVTATIYAILIGFVIVDEYTQLRSTQQQVSDKASALASVFENSRGIHEPDGEQIRAATLAYARSFSTNSFPALRHHATPDAPTTQALAHLLQVVHATQPVSPAEIASYNATLTALNSALTTRERLIGAARSTVPDALVWLLFVVGIVVMAVATSLDTQHRGSHLLILSALALVIWLTLALVVSMDYAFGGVIHINDSPIVTFVRAHSG
jgi:hypothetical protein